MLVKPGAGQQAGSKATNVFTGSCRGPREAPLLRFVGWPCASESKDLLFAEIARRRHVCELRRAKGEERLPTYSPT